MLRERLLRGPKWMVPLFVGVRSAAYRLVGPVDRLGLFLNNKRGFPPIHLRRGIGGLETFESAGTEFTAYLKLLCKLQPHHHIVDIGCGCGRLAIQLQSYLKTGSYTGFDIQRAQIDWCVRHIHRKSPNFSFFHWNVYNQRYNRRGMAIMEAGVLPIAAGSTDCIVAMSVLTHLMPEDVRWYFRECGRLLAPDGRALITVFLLDHVGSNSDMSFTFGDETYRYEHPASPENAVAYARHTLDAMLGEAGLEIQDIRPGSWSGRFDGLSYQDIILVGHRRSGANALNPDITSA